MPRTAAQLTTAEIDAFTRKLKATLALAQQALAIQAALGQAGGARAPSSKPAAKTATRTAKPTAAAPKKAGRGKRRPGIPPEKVAPFLSDKGLSVSEIAKKLGESSKDRVFAALDKLRAAKKAKVVGERIKARWFAA